MGSTGGDSCSIRKDDHNNHQNPSNHHHQYFFGISSLKMTLIFVVVGITCIFFNQSIYSSEFFQRSYSFSGTKRNLSSSSPSSCDCHDSMQPTVSSSFHHHITTENHAPSLGKEERELEDKLREAAMEDKKTVIITTLNAAWAKPNSIFDLFLEGFRIGNGTQKLLNHVLVGALDREAYSRCLGESLIHCYALTTDGVDFSGEAGYMTNDYLMMMWRRIDFLRTVLELGYDFVFTDVDIVWFRDPFSRFYPDGDFQIACDRYKYEYTSLLNDANGGFSYVRSNNRTIQFYKFWYTAHYIFPRRHDQDVFNLIKGSPFIQEIKLQIRFFNTSFFSGFCQPTKDLDLLITMHANCCIGSDKKIHGLKVVIDVFKKYMALSSNGSARNSSTWIHPFLCVA